MKLLIGTLCLVLLVKNGESDLVNSLPGAPSLPFKQYSGYYAVGDTKNHMLHYWFIESANNPATDPVLLWLTGGPGCSGLIAAFGEWGPLNTAVENWEALVAFFNEFPQYKNNDFYVTGESYGGNGCVSVNLGQDTVIPFMYAHGMIDDTEGGVNPYNIYANCDGILADSKRKNIKRRKDDKAPYPSVASLGLPCLDETAPTTYFNRQDVRKAMFIPTSLGKWSSCSNEIGTFYQQEYRDMSSRVKNAVNAGLKGQNLISQLKYWNSKRY
ncbi:hypothetical protein WR25_13899 isoform B [Diploscapter pachys]|uniref:Carboxypeptidase n=1 Tax=Diploscapter pachys TaxID=2018661 RepID=A0A2A2K515_9BILA|nr:hypothetical protein WR25_13899 isoform B [Diploscapter pachys]